MWASIPHHEAYKLINETMRIQAQAPAGRVLYVTNDKAQLPEAAASDKIDFHHEQVETWHARHIENHSVCIASVPWDRDDRLVGPADSRVYVYDPIGAAERVAEARKKEWEEKQKAKIAAKAEKDMKAVKAPAAPVEAAPAPAAAKTTKTTKTTKPKEAKATKAEAR